MMTSTFIFPGILLEMEVENSRSICSKVPRPELQPRSVSRKLTQKLQPASANSRA